MPPAAARWRPGAGIAEDVAGRLRWYTDDWSTHGAGFRLLAPSTYIFLASVLPALAFGQQLAMDTGGQLNVVHVLVSTALAGLTQALVGGQPLLILGVAEPIVLIYGFMYAFAASSSLGAPLFLAWASWVCVWTALLCLLLAVSGACAAVRLFTRFSGEVFGALIAVLFLQVGIKGMALEFKPAETAHAADAAAAAGAATAEPAAGAASYLTLINGLWGLLLAFGMLLTSLKVLRARRWLLGRAWLRGGLADYGVPLMLVAWSALSFAVRPAPGVPRRVETPNTWQVADSWGVAGRMGEVPGSYVAAALLPASIITVLFFFDHNVSAQLAQQPEFNLAKPSAYHYDFLLLAVLTLVCGLLGLPPVNGVLPQAPMHTRSLAHVCKRPRAGTALELSGAAPKDVHAGSSGFCDQQPAAASSPRATAAAGDLGRRRASGELRHRGGGHHSPERDAHSGASPKAAQHAAATAAGEGATAAQQLPVSASRAQLLPLQDAASDAPAAPAEQLQGDCLALEVREQRVSNLLQSLLVAVCLAATPAIQLLPTSALWGYFLFLGIQSLDGSQLWERTLLMLTDPHRRVELMQQEHAAYLQLVPFRVVVRFTLLQLACLAGVWALVTFGGVAGIAFPLPIMALVPLRQHLLPRVFAPAHLQQLDADAVNEAPAVHDARQAAQELRAVGAIAGTPAPVLPVAAGDASSADGVGLQPDEAELLSAEFQGLQLKHHLRPGGLALQRPPHGAEDDW